MTSTFHSRSAKTWTRVLTGLGLVGACSVVDKGDYTFTDNPEDSGGQAGTATGGSGDRGGTAGSSSGAAGTGGSSGDAGDGSGAIGGAGGTTGGDAGAGGEGGLCEPNPCEHDGRCTSDGTTTTCECADGYEGVTCGDEIDECDPNPCKNGVPCMDLVADFKCDCPQSVTGKICELPRFQIIPGPVTGVPAVARAVSADGTVVLGRFTDGMGFARPFIWTVQDGPSPLPMPAALRFDTNVTPWALSGDGTHWVGQVNSGTGTGGPPSPIGGSVSQAASFGLPPNAPAGIVFDVNNDGSKSVGNFTDGMLNTVHAVIWDDRGMPLPLMNPNGTTSPLASAGGITRDGSIVAGTSKDSMNNVFIVFWAEAGVTTPGTVRTITGISDLEVHAANHDASTTAGTYLDASGLNFAFITLGTRFVPLSAMGSTARSNAWDVSDDASAIVGEMDNGSGMSQQAVIWKTDGMFRTVIDVLRDSNVMTAGWILESALGVSADGKVIVGRARDANGFGQGFIARLP